MLSNLDLIREFIQNSIHKKDILLSNPSLTAQTVYKANQLSAKSEGVIAIAQISNTLCQFSISPNSSHWELINQALAEYSFLLKGEIDSRGFYQYQYCEIPKGYEMQCTKCVMLWRSWWKYRKYTSRPGIPLELLIRTRDSWYPIRDLIISDGLLYIKTLGTEIALDSNDLVTWLKKIEVS
ncbi:MAG: hypothetical protein RMY36_020520 [Nostoc sp. SerVER01]|uniref:hypothetical protein n=1 Tax=Nostoc sp. CCY 9925 TaxID=3103865 RepID=UPI002AD682E3|nr:hypothetical protein [Nostoc sp. SerVER01]MDZ8028258.1 hypothetical protein [Nostoc sp. DedQUE11]MDZ8078371.1 hypothetical protein [Nostoc sp. DcaGUA01]MDZ8241067.1 hypothetical protein [Nostoc sp. ChiQUE01a]